MPPLAERGSAEWALPLAGTILGRAIQNEKAELFRSSAFFFVRPAGRAYSPFLVLRQMDGHILIEYQQSVQGILLPNRNMQKEDL